MHQGFTLWFTGLSGAGKTTITEYLTREFRKEKRESRLFLDMGRNAYAQHAVAPYAVRPRDGAPVATPLDWSASSRLLI